MNIYENLCQEADADGITIKDYPFESDRIKGLYCDDTIGISNSIDTTVEKACVLAEELGHHHTTVGNIIELQDVQNIKQERKARIWAYDKLVGVVGLIKAFEHGCHSKYEIAEYLEVTEEFLQDAINHYQSRYPEPITIDHYVISFYPYLRVAKLF